MTDPDPVEAEPSAEWASELDRLIDWAIAQADAAVDEICSYLNQRAAETPLPAWTRGSLPDRSRGGHHACSPLGAGRPPRGRPTSG